MLDADADEEIREIKREIIESRGLIIKTNNLTNSLAADIKTIGKRQAGFERRFNWNSAAAYFLFAVLSFIGLKLAADARVGEIDSERAGLSKQVKHLRQSLNREVKRREARMRAETEAGRFYELIRQQKRQEVVERYASLDKERLSYAEAALFRDMVERFRTDLSMTSYQEGLGLMRTGRYVEAAEVFQKALQYNDEASHVPALRFSLARALRRLGRQSEAIAVAQQVVEQNLDRDLQADAAWLISQCAEDMGELEQAREQIRNVMRRWPRSAYNADARRRLRDISQKILHGNAAAKN